jgi:hypothetical protein
MTEKYIHKKNKRAIIPDDSDTYRGRMSGGGGMKRIPVKCNRIGENALFLEGEVFAVVLGEWN